MFQHNGGENGHPPIPPVPPEGDGALMGQPLEMVVNILNMQNPFLGGGANGPPPHAPVHFHINLDDPLPPPQPSTILHQIIPQSELEPKFSLLKLARTSLANFVFKRVLKSIAASTDETEVTEVKDDGDDEGERNSSLDPTLASYLDDLPVIEKLNLLNHLYSLPLDSKSLTRGLYLKSIKEFWNLLYCFDFPSIQIPNIHGFLLTRDDLIPDDEEENENHPPPHLQPPPHQQHLVKVRFSSQISGVYAHIISTINSKGPSLAKSVNFVCYSQRSVSTMKEKAEIFSLIENLRNVRVLELGLGCDDSILREIGRLCRHVTSLTASGINVTDQGIQYLAGQIYPTPYEPSDLCQTLKYLDVSNAMHVTELGVHTILCNFKKLERLKCQDTYFWRVLGRMRNDSNYSDYTLPLKFFEVGTSSSNGIIFLKSASKFFPEIEELVLWNFDPHLEINFGSFDNWNAFDHLSVLKFNNICQPDLTRILNNIGNQIRHLDIDNFSIDYSPISNFDLNSLGSLAPKLMHLSLTMCHCSVPATNEQHFKNLIALNVKGVTSEYDSIIHHLLLQTPNLQKFYLYSKLDLLYSQFFATNSKRSLDDAKLFDIVSKKRLLSKLQVFVVGVIDQEYGPFHLTATR